MAPDSARAWSEWPCETSATGTGSAGSRWTPASGRKSPSGVARTRTREITQTPCRSAHLPETDPVVRLAGGGVDVLVLEHRDRPVDLQDRHAHVVDARDPVLAQRLHQLLVVDPFRLQVLLLE